ncbi:MAG: hypothetical protein KKC46_22255 [Proteobacteria bacterium]|nr:hypothetical protein [Pseudomonadota bacterium]
MASNFRITAHQSEINLYLDLIGEFDGFSAMELINVLKKYSNKVKNIIINSSGLNLINPFVVGMLQKELMTDDSLNGLQIIGKHGNIMEPQEGNPFWC